ncbi:MAG TPA: hypothetical protein VK470_05800 [Bacteroidota bacterium]|nr:hypothetical protein [Bacteroidota bacterium]
MRVHYIASIVLVLFVFSCQAFTQTDDLQIGKPNPVRPGEPSNDAVRYEVIDVVEKNDAFEILYTITGSSDDEYEVTLSLLRDSDPKFLFLPKLATGDIGDGKFAGKINSIKWSYKNELPAAVKGNDYRFDLRIRKLEHRSFPWLWTGVGVAAGGAAAILLLSKKGNDGGGGTPLPSIGITRPQ